MSRLIPGFICLFLGALLFAIPSMTRRGVLFAVPVPPHFRESPSGRRSITEYHALVAIALLVVLCAVALSPAEHLNIVVVIGSLAILSAAALGFFRQRRKLGVFAIQPTPVREAELSGEPDRIPRFVWLGAVPFAILGAAAAFLHANWDRIPARFPVHWGADGQPNRWNGRTFHGVYGPLIFAGEMCAFFLILALAGWFGARRSRMRRIVLGALIAVNCTIALILAGVSVNAIAHFPIWPIVLGPMLLLALILFVAARKISGLGESAEPTPNECWRGGLIYYNPEDTALFVEKRTGFGYTVNFGNRWSWAFLAGLVAIIGSIRLLR
jgi:uncharacterized membrane protein